ncbi:MAG TPA: holo-ACP synthase [Burkholderiales bacterium]|nr:holo-ACP synthase [Burkholderiales bacterium]
MIAGIGVDLVDQNRIARLLKDYGVRFVERVLASGELQAYHASARPVAFLANRFAAKEALSKALGTGLRYPVTLHSISLVSDEIGRPELRFHGDLPGYLVRRGIVHSHLSLTDESGFACAMVVLESGK